MNFGKSKSDSELEFIATTLNKYDIVTIQEVVAGNGGAKAVSRLVAVLNNKGFQWDYAISDATTSGNPSSRERYAFLWKVSQVKKIGKSWLEQNFQKEIDREPFMSTFEYKGKQFTLASFHAVPKKKNPESEIKYFKLLPALYPKLNLIFMGDFNCPQSNTVFIPLKKKGYKSILANQKTSLRQKCINNYCLASEYDNMFYDAMKTTSLNSGIIPFYEKFITLKEARKISDHVPIWGIFQFK
jgi:endonuclease/exonuclease/phosphatase family metal-dependent hydrolase